MSPTLVIMLALIVVAWLGTAVIVGVLLDRIVIRLVDKSASADAPQMLLQLQPVLSPLAQGLMRVCHALAGLIGRVGDQAGQPSAPGDNGPETVPSAEDGDLQ